jgi:formylglycine-generating enzyme required for sulfatase activity
LDRFEVTVGRFRQFVSAVVGGYTPAAGAGKHSHLSSGGVSGETGWNASWNNELPNTAPDWDTALSKGNATWTSLAGANELRPMNHVNWYHAYAFCIWDGGFLPTESEWNYAAAGGSEQREYPWSNPPTSTTIDNTLAVYDCMGDGTAGCAFADILPVGSKSTPGDGRWLQSDLAGSVKEWTLDYYVAVFPVPCVDCAQLSGTDRVTRGGSWSDSDPDVLKSWRRVTQPSTTTASNTGVRCAREP